MGGTVGWPLGARLALPADGSAREDQRGLRCLSGFSTSLEGERAGSVAGTELL